jgi:hypothetical protein
MRDELILAGELEYKAQRGVEPWDGELQEAASIIRKQHAKLAAMTAQHHEVRTQRDELLQVLIGIHRLLLNDPIRLADGRTMVLKLPEAQEVLQELSTRIRAIPDAIAASQRLTPPAPKLDRT